MEKNTKTETIRTVLTADKEKLKLAFSRAFTLCAVSVFLCSVLLSAVNDMYAFVKPEESITVEISEPLTLSELSGALGEKNVINNPLIFSLYVLSKDKKEACESISGSFELNSSMSYRQILAEILSK